MKSKIKQIMHVFLAMLLLVCVIPMMHTEVKAASSGFYVSGNTIYDANGNPFVMRGVNVAHAWYTAETETSIKAIASKGANCVRIVCSNGAQYTKTSASELSRIIELCKQNNLVCILEVHDATGSDSTSDLDKAVNYWIEMKDIINANRQYVIVNIANEWYGTWDGAAWASGYKNAIGKLRNNGIENLLMVDCAGWGQYPDSIKYYGKSVFESDPRKNTMFSIHMYEYAGADSSTVRSNIDNALATGAPLVIGEFGWKHTNGDVDEYTIMQYCQQKGVGYIGWSWKGNGSEWAYLDLANTFDGSSMSDWGNTLFYGDNGISKTAQTCSVFNGSTGGSDNNNNNNNNNNDYNESGLDGEYYIKNVYSGKYLDVYNGSSANGTNVQQYAFNGSDAQKFKLVNDGNGYYTIYTAASGYNSCIDVTKSSSENGTNIQQWSAHGGDCQKFQFVNLGGKYVIKTKVSNCYSSLDVYNWSKNNGGNIAQWEYLDGENQQWYLEKVSNNDSNNNNNNNDNNNGQDEYISLFWGSQSASNWNQAVSVMTSKNGGSFDASQIKQGGYFYVEYDGNQDEIELVLQSWSGGTGWAKVNISESGWANGHRYAKFSYDACVSAFGTSDFAGQLDQIHASAKNSDITVYSVCYCY